MAGAGLPQPGSNRGYRPEQLICADDAFGVVRCRVLLLLVEYRLIFRRGNVLPGRILVLAGFDGFCGWGGFAGGDSGHDYFFAERVPRAACGETSRWAGCGTSRSAAASCFALGRRPLNSAGNLACS